MAWLYTVLNPTKAASGVWWIWYSSKCKASMAWLYAVLNPTKAAGGVWWIWYSSKCKASMAWLYTVLNPTKAADGVWWIWYSSKCKASWLGYTQSWIQQKQPMEFDGFGTVANAKHHGLAIRNPESNKSSRWCLMDLVVGTHGIMLNSLGYTHMYSTESTKTQQNQPEGPGGWILMDLG